MIEPNKIVMIRIDTPDLLNALDSPTSLALQVQNQIDKVGDCPTHFVLYNQEKSLAPFPLEPLLGNYLENFNQAKKTMDQVLSTARDLLYPLPPLEASKYLLWYQRLLLNPTPLALLDNATGRVLGCSQGYSDLTEKSLAFWQSDTKNNTRWESGSPSSILEAFERDRSNGIAAPVIRGHEYLAEHCCHPSQRFTWNSSFQYIPAENAPLGLRLTEVHSVKDNSSTLFQA